MTTPTSNPVPSNDPRDLLFNAGVLDAVVHSINPTFTDRFGAQRLTVAGALNSAIESIKSVNVRGAWVSGSLYAVKDVVSNGGAWYIAVAGHVAGASFAGDSSKWVLYQGLTYADLQKYIGETVSLRSFGVLASDGATDDAALFQLAAASGAPVIDARGIDCFIGSTINIPAGQTWLLAGASITIASSTLTVFRAQNVDDWALLGPFKITGDGSTVGTAKGVRVDGCFNWRVSDYTAENIRGWGFYLDPGAATLPLTNHGDVKNFRAQDCYIGWEDLPGTGAEYMTLTAPIMRHCTLANMITAAGNIITVGGHITEGLADGVILKAGTNHGHGIFIGTNINHNAQFNLRAVQVINGYSFMGCHWYANDAVGGGSIFLDRCKGIHISGGNLDCQIYNYKDGSSGMNVIENMFCPGGYGVTRRAGSNDGHDQLAIRGCFGPGAYVITGGIDVAGTALNDTSLCYVQAQRVPGSTQALVSGAPANIVFPVESRDRRLAYDNATGVFTVPADQPGIYRVNLDALFGGTTVTPATSFVDIKVNGASFKLVPITGLSSGTKGSASCNVELPQLPGGATIELAATITGTGSLVFGDPTWQSSLSIERIA